MAGPAHRMARRTPDRDGAGRRSVELGQPRPGQAGRGRGALYHHERLSARPSCGCRRGGDAAGIGRGGDRGRQAAWRGAAEPARDGPGRSRHPPVPARGRQRRDVAAGARHAEPHLRSGRTGGRRLHAGEPEPARPSGLPVRIDGRRACAGLVHRPAPAAHQPGPVSHPDRRGRPDPLVRTLPALDRRDPGRRQSGPLRTRHRRDRLCRHCDRAGADGL